MGTYASYASLARELNALFYSTAAPTRTASESEIARIHFRVSFSYRLRTAQRMARKKKVLVTSSQASLVIGKGGETVTEEDRLHHLLATTPLHSNMFLWDQNGPSVSSKYRPYRQLLQCQVVLNVDAVSSTSVSSNQNLRSETF